MKPRTVLQIFFVIMFRLSTVLPYSTFVHPFSHVSQTVSKRSQRLYRRNRPGRTEETKHTTVLYPLKEPPHNPKSFNIVETREESFGGHSVIVQCPYAISIDELKEERDFYPEISDEEILHLKNNNFSTRRVSNFIGGRLALKNTPEFQQFAPSFNATTLWNEFGGPNIPNNFTASLSHKDEFCVAIAKGLDKKRIDGNDNHQIVHEFLGVDIEEMTYKNINAIIKRVLSPREVAKSKIKEMPVEQDTMLRFSFKEAVYKALNVAIRRFIGFKEVEIYPLPDGTAEIHFLLKPGLYNPSVINYTATWREFQDYYFITTVKIELPFHEKETPFLSANSTIAKAVATSTTRK
jgi:4'-phosphopantetheinyl transferase EntD